MHNVGQIKEKQNVVAKLLCGFDGQRADAILTRTNKIIGSLKRDFFFFFKKVLLYDFLAVKVVMYIIHVFPPGPWAGICAALFPPSP